MTFNALVKEVKVKALVSGDKSVHIVLETEDIRALELVNAPADEQMSITVVGCLEVKV